MFISNLPTEEEIRTAAYHIWQREGQTEGREEEHWEQARRACYRSRGRKELSPSSAHSTACSGESA
ncbi:MAG: DUF2934 domain-containing protein [Chloroflexia bacterium]|nr:DUF2934 domain-containing protein [Chloroflexia bacterium]